MYYFCKQKGNRYAANENMHYSRPFEADSRRIFRIGLGFSKTSHTIESSIIE